MLSQAAYQLAMPTDKGELVAEIERGAAALSQLNVDKSVLDALRRGAAAMSEGRLPLSNETQ